MNIPVRIADSVVYRDIPVGYALGVSFANNLRMLRTAAGLTQTDLAKKVQVGQGAVSKWEKGESFPNPTKLPDIAIAVNGTLNKLLAGINTKYDTDCARADMTHPAQGEKKKSVVQTIVTIPVPHPDVLDQLHAHSGGGQQNADAAAGGSGAPDRLSQSTSAISDARVQQLFRFKELFTFIQRLDQSAGAVQSVADALRSRLTTTAPRKTGSKRPGSSPDIRRPKRRRGGAR